MRGIGLAEVARDLPEIVVVPFAVLTQLGDLWLMTLLAVVPYWLVTRTPLVGAGVDRERAAVVLALLCTEIALTTTLKPLLAFDRPPGYGVAAGAALVPDLLRPVYAETATADGFGFPSGHALGSTIVWGGLAWATRVGRPRTRALVAGVVVVAVSLARVVLGVHFLVDVLAGAALGVVVLALALGLLRTPLRVFALAASVAVAGLALGAAGVLVEGVTHDLAAAAGLCVGAALAWALCRDALRSLPSPRGALVAAGLGIAVAAPLLLGTLFLADSLAVAVVLAAAGGAVFVLAPLAAHYVLRSP